MNNRQRTVRSIHAWLGLITGIQLLFWCAGGLVFSTHNIEWVRGNHGRDNSPAAILQTDTIATSPADAIATSELANVREITLTTLLGKAVYRLTGQEGAVLVDAASGNTHVYVDQATGTVASRRNDAWRQFDFFWMLHTMDYSGRDNFNTPWLIGFSVLALLSVSSGWDIWVFRFARARKRQPA